MRNETLHGGSDLTCSEQSNLAVLYQKTLHASAIAVVCTVSALDFGCPRENLHLGIDLVVGTEAGRGQTQD